MTIATNSETIAKRHGSENTETLISLKGSRIQSFPVGAIVIQRNVPENVIFIVIHGLAKAVKVDANGDERLLTYYGPGEYFSWIEFNEDRGINSILAVDPCRFLVIELNDVKGFHSQTPLFRQSLLANLAREIELKSDELLEVQQQKTAISQILEAISASSINDESILRTVAGNAAQLCDGKDAEIFKVEGDKLRLVAKHGQSGLWPIGTKQPINRDWVAARAVVDLRPIHVVDLQASAAEFPVGASLAKQFGHRSTFATPLIREGVAIGAILIRRMEVRPLTEKQIVLLKTFADEAAIAIENVRLFQEVEEKSKKVEEQANELRQWNLELEHRVAEQARELTRWNRELEARVAQQVAQLERFSKLEHELSVASEIQKSMLPRTIPCLEGFEFSATMVPAKSVGGDFFDFIPLGNNLLGIAIGDVSDKGVPAALFMAMVRSLLRAEAHPGRSAEKVLRSVNSHLMDMNDQGMFVTILYGVLNGTTGQFQYVRAGHEVPIFCDGIDSFQHLPMGRGQALGVFKDIVLEEQSVTLSKGSMLLLCSDGITDAPDQIGTSFGYDGVIKTIKGLIASPVSHLCEELIKAANTHQGDSLQHDDMTTVIIRAG